MHDLNGNYVNLFHKHNKHRLKKNHNKTEKKMYKKITHTIESFMRNGHNNYYMPIYSY